MIALLRRYLPRYKWPLLLVIVLLFVQAVGTLYLPELNAVIINEGVVTGDTDVILSTGAIMLAVSLVLMVAAIVGVYYSARVAMGFGRDVRSAIFRSVELFSQADVNQFGAATLITRNTNDVQQVQQVLLMALTMLITAPILLVGGLIMALRQDVPLSGVLVVVIPILLLLIALVMRRAIPLFGALQRKTDHINLVTRETLTGIRVIRAFVRTGHEERRFDAANHDYMETALSLNRLFAITMPALMLLMNLSLVAVLWFGAFRVESGEMPIGNLTAFMQYIMQILMAIMTAVLMLVVIPRAAVSGGRIQEVLDTRPSVQDPPSPTTPTQRGHVELRGVTFGYPGAEEPVLRDVSFEARPGETTAIVGSTGSGKTTLVNLLPRLYDVTEGAVFVDGVDVRERGSAGALEAHRHGAPAGLPVQRHRGQQPALRRRGGHRRRPVACPRRSPRRPTSCATCRRDWSRPSRRVAPTSPADSASAWPSHEPWPSGRASTSSTTASPLSTSAPTPDCGPRLGESWTTATVIIVAQRVGTILHADRIVVLESGAVVGMGTHEELMASCETYREIVLSQVSEEEAA